MDVKGMNDQAKIYAGMDIPITYAKKYINEAMTELSNRFDTACVENSFMVDTTDLNIMRHPDGSVPTSTTSGKKRIYILEDKCLGVSRVLDSNYEKYDDYKVTNRQLYIADDGKYTVFVLTPPSDVGADTSIPAINAAFHQAICHRIAADYLYMIDPTSEKAKTHENKFLDLSIEADARLKRSKRKGIILPVGRWR